MDYIHANWAPVVSIPNPNQVSKPYWSHFQPMQNEQFAQINQPRFNHPIDSFAAACHFWISLLRDFDTSPSPTTVPETMKPTPTQSNEQRKPREPSLSHRPIWPDSDSPHDDTGQGNDGDYHPFPGPQSQTMQKYETDQDEGIGGVSCHTTHPWLSSSRKATGWIGNGFDWPLGSSVSLCHMLLTRFHRREKERVM